jgi:hypothetical protein
LLLKPKYSGSSLFHPSLASPHKQQENIVEKRLAGEVKPDRYERKAAAEFERRRKTGKLEFIPLSEIEENL